MSLIQEALQRRSSELGRPTLTLNSPAAPPPCYPFPNPEKGCQRRPFSRMLSMLCVGARCRTENTEGVLP